MADVRTDLEHIVVRRTATSEPYQYPGTPRAATAQRDRDRVSHANKLVAQLLDIAALVAAREQEPVPEGLVRGSGTYVTFESDPGDVLDLDRLEDQRIGLRVLAVREEETGEGEPARLSAAVFVPEGKLDRITKKVEDYRDKDTTKDSGKPKNQPLVESVADVAITRLSDLWTEWGAPFPDATAEVWWEVWLRAEEDDDAEGIVEEFREQASAAGLVVSDREIVFPERVVVLVKGTAEQIEGSVFLLDTLAELRQPRETAEFFESLPPSEVASWVRDAADRVSSPGANAPAVCVFDTGVNRGHPLIEPALAEEDMHAYGSEWSTADDLPAYPGGHGTEMAGLSLYGDLAEALTNTGAIRLDHRLESVRIIPPTGKNSPELYGDITKDGVAQAEVAAPERSRVCMMAVSSKEHPYKGQPSSWSSAVDQLCYGADTDGEHQRLFVVSAGNASHKSISAYPDGNETDAVHDPGQAWNALTVGAFTDRDWIDPEAHPGWTALASRGGLAPSSTTSLLWDHRQTPLKPDVVMEGGNYGVNPDDGSYDFGHPPSLRLLTTHRRFRVTPVTTSGDTSGAAALAARLAARISARYPDLWPETVRALIVHSARWTDEMLDPFDPSALSKQGHDSDLNVLLRKYGYGVPDERAALSSASDSLTLIAQDELRPFMKGESYNVKTNKLNVHRLPWPTDVLQHLPSGVKAQMRVTLSYYVEPSPSSAGAAPVRSRFRYPSHGLRFDAKTPTETENQFRERINKLVGEDTPETQSDAGDWTLGPTLRTRGSVHSDWWEGSAAELAGKNVIAVYPVSGWWKERKHHGRWDRSVRYSLVVTIRTPSVLTDIYTPVKALVAVTV